MTSHRRHLLDGALAGAAVTTAPNAMTFADVALRKRPASSTSEQTVERGVTLGSFEAFDERGRER